MDVKKINKKLWVRLSAGLLSSLILIVGFQNFDGPSTTKSDTFLGRGGPVNIGQNVYSPSIVYQNGKYLMYYGGQQNAGTAVYDQMYLKTSTDKINWSAPIALFSAKDISPRGVHVNDPSVVVNGLQYTMFYTYTESEHEQNQTQIYSAISSDGIHWAYHKQLLSGGPGEPSAITEQTLDGMWLVYFVDRTRRTQVRRVRVNYKREPVGAAQSVFIAPNGAGLKTISSPEVRFFNGVWQLFFNQFENNGSVDLYKITSTNNSRWEEYTVYPSTDPRNPIGGRMVLEHPITLIVKASTDPNVCAVITPAIFPTSPTSNLYDLYFGMSMRYPNGSCPIYPVGQIMRWEMQSL